MEENEILIVEPKGVKDKIKLHSSNNQAINIYRPRGAVKQLWKCHESEILLEGPAGTGKTRGILEKILALCIKYPGSRHLICRKTRASMTQSVLVTFEEKVLPPESPIKNGPQRSQRQSYKIGKSEIVVSGLDKPERTFSTEYDTITVFEAIEITEHEWESLHRALRNGVMPYQQAIADTNPGQKGHWLNKRAKAAKMIRLKSKHEDNPRFYNYVNAKWTPEGETYIARLERLSGARKQRLFFGRWASAEGAVYNEWDPDLHIIDHRSIPVMWRKIRSIDFGYTNPFVCQWWAFDEDDNGYLYREVYKTKTLVEDHAKRIKELSQGEEYIATVSDHDAEDRATLERHGIETVAAYKGIQPGIENVQRRMRKQGNGKPKMYILRDALVELDADLEELLMPTCTEEEVDGYIYPDNSKADVPRNAKEDPVDKDNHGMDAMRYAFAYMDGVPFGPVEESGGYIGGATTNE